MRSRRPLVVFWIAVVIDVVALGLAWSAWKTFDTDRLALLVAAPASAVCVAASLVAGRILAVVGRCDPIGRKP